MDYTKLTESELSLHLELAQTRNAALAAQQRALQAELQLAQVAKQEFDANLKALMAEKQRRAAPTAE
jgi:hypothetical protein